MYCVEEYISRPDAGEARSVVPGSCSQRCNWFPFSRFSFSAASDSQCSLPPQLDIICYLPVQCTEVPGYRLQRYYVVQRTQQGRDEGKYIIHFMNMHTSNAHPGRYTRIHNIQEVEGDSCIVSLFLRLPVPGTGTVLHVRTT